MLSYSFYKVAHLVGIFMVLLPLGALCFHVSQGGTRDHTWRRFLALTHGFGMLISIVAGFGLLKRLDINGVPGWAIAKIVIWLFLGAMIGAIYRAKSSSKLLWNLTLLLAFVAAFLAVTKPN